MIHDPAAATPTQQSESQTRIDVGGHTLRVDLAGSGEPNLLCLHGLVDRLEVWHRLAQPLAQRGRVIRADHLTPKLTAIQCPVLLIVGENDPMGPTASSIIADALPHAQLEVVPECGHWVHVEKPEAVLAAFDAWAPKVDLA